MNLTRSYQNLVLGGFMGAGKTSAGRIVARLLRFQFVDTDALIEKRAGGSVEDIFSQLGELAFRALERKVVAELSQYRHAVIATGGGLTASEENLKSLKRHALVVCLWATPDGIWQRVKHSRHRPLLKTENPREKIKLLLAARTPYYKQADVLIQTESRSTWMVAKQVAQAYRQACHRKQ